MPKCGPIGSYGQNQAIWAHVWDKNGPKTARNATGLGLATDPNRKLSQKLKTHPDSPEMPLLLI
jgi:hypothetical protein